MANNPYANKVIYGNQTIMDLSGDTVVASDVLQGKTFHDATGALLVGTYTPSASGYTIHIFTEDSNLFGNTITISKDDVVLGTTTFDNTGNATFDVQQKGTYVASTTYQGTVYQKAVDVTDEFLVELSETIDGKTVLPTDDIQIWLKCAGINDKAYTTLAEVLADTTTLLALINSPNAVDYMVRSTTWAVSVSVPVMTSNTTPSGECSADSVYNTNTPAWKAFDGDDSTFWIPTISTSPNYIEYDFASPVKVKKVTMKVTQSIGGGGYPDVPSYVQVWNGEEWVSISNTVNVTTSSSNIEYTVNNDNVYSKHRIYFNGAVVYGNNRNFQVNTVRFDGDDVITDNSTAMSYIGLNNYCSNTLLADSTWCEAILLSEYVDSVCSPIVPKMTSNTTPNGVCSASSVLSSSYPAWHAFDRDASTFWHSATNGGNNGRLTYQGTSAYRVRGVKLVNRSIPSNMVLTFKIQGSNNGVDWVDLTDVLANSNQTSGGESAYAVTIDNNYTYHSLLSITTDNGTANIAELQFYGREDVVEPQPVTERVLYDRGTENTPFTMGASPAFKNAAVKQQDAIQMNYSSSSSYGFKTTDAIDVSDYDTLKVYIAVNGDEQTENYQFVATADLSRYSTVQLLIGYIGNTVQIQASETVGGTRYVIGADGSRYNLAVKVYKIWLEKSCVNC